MLDSEKILAPGTPYTSQDYDKMACQCLDRAMSTATTPELEAFWMNRAQVLATLAVAAAQREKES